MNTAFEKLKKVPGFVQTLLVGLAILFSDLVTLRTSFYAALTTFAEMFSESGVEMAQADLNSIATVFAWMYWIMVFLLGIVIFELIAYLVYRSMYGKRQIDGQKGYVMTVVRFTFIACAVVSGALKLFGFLNYYVALYLDATLDVVLYPVAFTAAYAWLLHTGHVYSDRAGTAYNTLFWVWFGITGVLAVWGLIQQAVSNVLDPQIHALVVSVLEVVFTAGTGAALWFTARKKFMDIQKNPPPVDFGGSGDNEIFRGYGL